ncbi:hypothetical protein EMIT0P100_150030 [Pseudomonas sp. IT-P100]
MAFCVSGSVITCGEGACSRSTAKQSQTSWHVLMEGTHYLIQGRCAPQREQAPSPQ